MPANERVTTPRPRRRSVRAAVAAACALTALLAAGCASETATRAYELDLPAGVLLLAVDVENFAGSVEVRGDHPERGEVRVRSAVTALAPEDAEARETFDPNRAVLVTAVMEHDGDRAVLRVRSASARPGGPEPEDSAALLVTAPQLDGVRVVNAGGLVEVVAAEGTADVRNQDGSIIYRSNRPMTRDATFLATDGHVYVQIPPGSQGRYDLRTLLGEAAFKDSSGDADETYALRTELTTTLGDADNTVVARTNRGDIRFWVMPEPERLTRVSMPGLPESPWGVFLDGSRRHTRNLPDDTERRPIFRPGPFYDPSDRELARPPAADGADAAPVTGGG